MSELEHPSSASQDDDSDDMDFSSTLRKSRLSAPLLQAQLSRLSDRTSTQALEEHIPLQGCVAASGENRRLVAHACLPQAALPRRRMCGKCPDAARPRHQRAEKTQQQNMGGLWSVPIVWFPLGPTTLTRRNPAAPPKPLEATTRAFMQFWVD